MGLAGLAAHLAGQPLLRPSLGPTIYRCFEQPLDPSASLRNTLIGHGVALVLGYAALALFGILHSPGAVQAGVTPARIGAAALAIAVEVILLTVVCWLINRVAGVPVPAWQVVEGV